MATFKEANNVRVSLKMKLSQYAWYHSSVIAFSADDYSVIIYVSQLNNQIRKIIAPVVNGISIKTEMA